MKITMPFKDYLEILRDHANVALSLDRVTMPFEIASDNSKSDVLLVGHLLDDMCEHWKPEDQIDCLDVATVALELGHDQALRFLDEAPWIVARAVGEERGMLN